MAEELKASLGLDISNFLDGLKNGSSGLEQFAANFVKTAGVIGITTKVLGDLAGAFKQTTVATDALNIISVVYKQTLSDIINLQESHIADAIATAEKQNDLRKKEMVDMVTISKLNYEVSEFRLEAADHTKTDTERINDYGKAIEKVREQEKIRVDNALEKFNISKKAYEDDLANEKKKQEMLKNEADYYNILEESNMRLFRMTSARTSLIEKMNKEEADGIEHTKKLMEEYAKAIDKDLVDAIEKANKTFREFNETTSLGYRLGQELPGGGKAGYAPTKQLDIHAPTDALQLFTQSQGIEAYGGMTQETLDARALNGALEDQQKAVVQLSEEFGNMFRNVNKGFQGMIDGAIKGVERMVQELIARAAILEILSLITTGGLATPEMMNSILPRGMGTFMNMLSSPGGSQVTSMGEGLIGSVGGQNININGVIKGSDLALVLRRNT